MTQHNTDPIIFPSSTILHRRSWCSPAKKSTAPPRRWHKMVIYPHHDRAGFIIAKSESWALNLHLVWHIWLSEGHWEIPRRPWHWFCWHQEIQTRGCGMVSSWSFPGHSEGIVYIGATVHNTILILDRCPTRFSSNFPMRRHQLYATQYLRMKLLRRDGRNTKSKAHIQRTSYRRASTNSKNTDNVLT